MAKRRWAAAIAAIVMLVGAAFVHSQVASAHALPVTTVPAMGSVVETAPTQLEITFSQGVSKQTTVAVVGPDDESVVAVPAQIDPNDPTNSRVIVGLYGNLPNGIYNVIWQGVSAEDGTADTGSYTFTVGPVSATPGASPNAGVAGVTGDSQTTLSAQEQVNAAAEAAQEAASAQAASEDNFDGRAYFISVVAGFVAAMFIWAFWRKVKPKQRGTGTPQTWHQA